MKYCSLLAVVIILLAGCLGKEELPAGVFPINRMKLIVWDMEMADQTATEKFPSVKDSLRMEATSLYQQVFLKYKTDKKTFYSSFSYYEAHPVLLKALLDSAGNYGAREKQKVYKKTY